jgi:hypothetical protein
MQKRGGHGEYEELPDRIGWRRERDRARSLPSMYANWWELGGLKSMPEDDGRHLFYRIVVDHVTGQPAHVMRLAVRKLVDQETVFGRSHVLWPSLAR